MFHFVVIYRVFIFNNLSINIFTNISLINYSFKQGIVL